jgi:hypothetical protein
MLEGLPLGKIFVTSGILCNIKLTPNQILSRVVNCKLHHTVIFLWLLNYANKN